MGTFKHLMREDDEYAQIMFSNETKYRFLNLVTRKVSGPFDYAFSQSYGKHDKLYDVSIDGKKYLYNLKTDTIIGGSGRAVATALECPILKVTVDGGRNLYNTKFGFLLPKPFKRLWDSSSDGHFLIETEDQLGYYYRYNESNGVELLSNPNGFNINELYDVYINSLYLVIDFENGLQVRFNRDNGQVKDIKNFGKEVDNETVQKLVKNIFPTPSISQISEGFKNLWSRMLDL